MIAQIRKRIDKSLDQFFNRIRKEYKLDLVSTKLFNCLKEYNLREGKRIRPLLLVLAYMGYSPEGKKISPTIYNGSTCIELLHNFMLIHDDIIDRSDLRRGKPTLHRMLENTIKTDDPNKLGSDLSIIAGDIVYALALDAFISIDEDPRRKEKGLKYFIQTAAYTAMGEYVDTIHGVDKIDNITEKDVYLNYSLKTARYTFDCPLVTGAILAGADKKEIKKLSEFALGIGQAFQIQDDIIGLFETEKNIGKSILSDLAESKKTLLMCHANSVLKGKAKKEFLAIFNKPEKTMKDLEAVKTILINSGSLEYALKAIESRLQRSHTISKRLTIRDKFRKYIHESLFTLFKQTRTVADRYNIEVNITH